MKSQVSGSLGGLLALVVGFSVSLTEEASADLIRYEASADFILEGGPDGLGLDGASFAFTVDFDSTDVYVDRFGLPSITADGDSLMITGASNPNSNDTFSKSVGMIFYPTFNGQFFGGPDEGSFAEWTIDGRTLQMENLAELVSGVLIGDQIDPSHFGLVPGTAAFFNDLSDGSRYSITNFTARVLPGPAAAGLFALFACADPAVVAVDGNGTRLISCSIHRGGWPSAVFLLTGLVRYSRMPFS